MPTPPRPPSLIFLLLGEGLSFPLQARHRPLAALETSAAPRGSDPLGFPAGAARRSPAGTRGCPKDEHMFNNPEIRAPKPSLAWPGPLVSPDAQTTQLFLKLGQKQAPGGWQRWEGLFSPAWELQNKGQTLGILSFPRLRERPLSASPGAGSRWIRGDITAGTSRRGHHPLLPTPAATPAAGKQHLPACLPGCSRLAAASQLDFAPCTCKVRQCPRLELPAPHARPAQLPTPFSADFKAAGGSCFLLLC